MAVSSFNRHREAAAPSSRHLLGIDSWTQVTEFPVDSSDIAGGDEWEETEELVMLDLGPAVTAEHLSRSSDFQLAYLNSSTPYLSVGGTILRGQHEQLIGTELIMQRGQRSAEEQGAKPSFVPLASLYNRVRFQPVELKARASTRRKGRGPSSSSASSVASSAQEDGDQSDQSSTVDAEVDATNVPRKRYVWYNDRPPKRGRRGRPKGFQTRGRGGGAKGSADLQGDSPSASPLATPAPTRRGRPRGRARGSRARPVGSIKVDGAAHNDGPGELVASTGFAGMDLDIVGAREEGTQLGFRPDEQASEMGWTTTPAVWPAADDAGIEPTTWG